MGIVHGEAGCLPDFLEYFSTGFSSAPVKMEILGKKDIETTTMANFYSQVSGRDRWVGDDGRRASGASFNPAWTRRDRRSREDGGRSRPLVCCF